MELELELELKITELELELNWKNGIDPNPDAVRYIYHVYFHVIQQDFTLCCDMLFVSFISVLCDWVFCNIIA